jgi:uncharacterized membrane protein
MTPDRASAATAALAAALGGWSLLWYLVLFPTAAWVALTLALPALLCAWFVWNGSALALGCAGFGAIGYLAHGLMELVANPPERIAAGVAVGLAAALLASATHALRRFRPAARI